MTKSKQEELAELSQKLNDELRQELLERKQKALLALEQGKVISEEELYLEMEGLVGK